LDTTAYNILNKLKGQWYLTGQMGNILLSQKVEVDWALNNNFIKMEFIEEPAPVSKAPYLATYFIGYDTDGKKFIFHLLDSFGPKFSQTLGFGQQTENGITFEFKYPDCIFQNIFTFIPESNSWTMLLQHQSQEGVWIKFAEKKLVRLHGSVL
jgi:hypothetical protein